MTGDKLSKRWEHLAIAARFAPPGGDWAEFGVSTGRSARVLLRFLPDDARLLLFDSFAGLPRKWLYHKAGAYACEVPTFDDERVRVVGGWFQDTVGPWFRANDARLTLVHFDCDLYESTVCCMQAITGKLAPGAVIVFDEMFHLGIEMDEARAWREWEQPAKQLYRSGAQAIFKLRG